MQIMEYTIDYIIEHKIKYIKNDTTWTMRSAI